MKGFGVLFSGVLDDGHTWLALSVVSAQEMVYTRPSFFERASGTATVTLPVPAPETSRVAVLCEETVTLRVTCPRLSPGSEDSDASTITCICPRFTWMVPFGATVTPLSWTKSWPAPPTSEQSRKVGL